jgi:hypothetical protein
MKRCEFVKGSIRNARTYHKDGTSLEVNIVRERNLSLDSVSGLIQLKLRACLDGLSDESGILTLEEGSKTREFGKSCKRDVCRVPTWRDEQMIITLWLAIPFST